jgi:cell fate regulator YaaT (PSP1 superfamily)
MIAVVQIRLRQAGQTRFFRIGGADAVGAADAAGEPDAAGSLDTVGGLDLKPGDYCIVQAERGLDFGQVLEFEEPLLMVVRKITINDRFQINKNIRDAETARQTCLKKVEAHALPMKLVDAEYSFDRSKIVFYFTADGRVDFRALVKDLARAFRARIELRQIGVRDESKLLGGIGCCGRVICCQSWLRGFSPINIRMAKDQHLSLNPTKLSGVCGRLLCCLKYEHDSYRELAKGLPGNGTIVKTDRGKGTVIDQDILKRALTVRLDDDRVGRFALDEVEILQAKEPRKRKP